MMNMTVRDHNEVKEFKNPFLHWEEKKNNSHWLSLKMGQHKTTACTSAELLDPLAEDVLLWTLEGETPPSLAAGQGA